jgi:nitrate reductase (NAD(P)H)
MNEFYDVILAYKMNGEWLSPDHGFPLRVIVPGCIGGRSVKWLTKICVSETESSNIYHYVDNKVFPSFVDKDLADAEKWWYKPEYTLYDLNVNSAILCPDHGAILPVSRAITDEIFNLRGYAYSGGNRKITRVELSFDGGESWELATLTHPEEHEPPELAENNDHGYERVRHWCWALWSHSIKPSQLLRCQEISVRAWDEAQNTQPGNFSWNLMGMMNNSWFTIKVDIVETPSGSGLRFRHPTIAGPEKGGWLDVLQPEKQTVAKDTKPLTDLKTYGWREVEKHIVDDDCWIVVRDTIYDCTPFMKAHPGGIDSILLVGGQDCTEDFDAIHSTAAHEMLQQYKIGTLAKDTQAPVVDHAHSDTTLDQFLEPKIWKSLVLEKKVYITQDICVFRFAFSSPAMKHGLPVGQHVYLRCRLDSKLIVRAYTPSLCGDGFLEFIIKIYRPVQEYPLGGLFTQQLDKLSIGDSIETKGPLGSFEYFGMGRYIHHLKRQGIGHAKDIGMICAGTGITPIWQVLMAISQELGDQSTRISLIYGNRYEEDIILRQELEDMALKLGPGRMSLR